jgi:hypothetical protein
VLDVLARGPANAGHDVLLYTTGDSTCPVSNAWTIPKSVGTNATASTVELRHVINAYEAATAWRADIVHDHTLVGPVWSSRLSVPVVTTNHGPFVATPCGSVPEIIDDGLTRFLRTSDDDLAEAVADCAQLDRPTVRAAAADRFSSTRMIRDHVALYERVLTSKRARSRPDRYR